MHKRFSSFLQGRRRATAAAVLFSVIAILAVAGTVLLAAQERSRLRISAEYRVFQLVTEMLRFYDSGELVSIDQVDGVRAFAVYSRRGEKLYGFGNVPAAVAPQDASEQARFDGGVVSFIRFVGGNPFDAQRGRRGMMQMGPQDGVFGGSPGGPGPVMGQGMGMGNGRFVYIAYDTAALRSGERVVFIIAFFVLISIAGAFYLLFSLVRSLDEYREREIRNQELLALGEAARTLTHEIKNPLGVVKIQCALLRKTASEEAKNGLRVIEEETDRLALLASRVKAFLSADEGAPRQVSVSDTIQNYAARYGDRLVAVCDPGAAASRVFIDPLRLDQIVDNLISNAVESMDESSLQPPVLNASAGQGFVRFRVSDQGKGIDPKDRDRVFDLFYTTKTSGAGIGLALAKRYAEAAGGRISHSPGQGGGTVFELALPESKG